jgi:L-ascorbate metabolism protein UlaG (beta-lactamase superfamily)
MNQTEDTGTKGLVEWIHAHIRRLDQSAMQITAADGAVIYIDLFAGKGNLPPGDYFFVTHPHGDHFKPGLIRKLAKPGAKIVVPASVKASGADGGVATDGVAPGETRKIGAIEVSGIPAYNKGKMPHPRKAGFCGYLLNVDGIRIYHAGDTDFIPEMENMKPDIAMLPVGGGIVTMDWKNALKAADALKTKVVIPMHYGLIPFTGNRGRKFRDAWNGTTVLL